MSATDPMDEPYRIMRGAYCRRFELLSDPCYLILFYGNPRHPNPYLRLHGTWMLSERTRWETIRAADADDPDALERAWLGTFTFKTRWPEEWEQPEEVFPWQAWADA